ncbi:uncharacterized protein LOC141860007 [Acropora palmata]|uniref:uncharacterized protein LOC141860007 n=1 Tax=Acropora palmata TaxID=6131 RepID=UPI003DA0DC97
MASSDSDLSDVEANAEVDDGERIVNEKSQRKSLKDENDSGPEHEALLVSEKETKSAQMQAGSQTDSRCFENLNESTACACQKWLFVTIFMPLILILSILGGLLLAVFAPFELCCPEGGVYNKMVTFLFEVLLKAPCVACKWAAEQTLLSNRQTPL